MIERSFVRHHINQSLRERETDVDLKCQMSHKPANIYAYYIQRAFTNEVLKVICVCVKRIARSIKRVLGRGLIAATIRKKVPR